MLERLDRIVAPTVWLVAAVLVAMLFAGPQIVAEDQPTPPSAKKSGGGSTVSGKAVFSTTCASCHTLTAAGAVGTVGPSLEGVQLGAETVERIVREGRGLMPSFSGRLSEAEVNAVAAFVSQASGG